MDKRPLVIWCNLRLDDPVRSRLEQGVGRHRLLWAGNLNPNNLPNGSPDPALAAADVAFGQPEPVQCASLPRLSWIQLSSAGYNAFDDPAIRAALTAREASLTSSSAVFAEPCAQHALALMLSEARRLPEAFGRATADRSWPKTRLRTQSVLLRKQTVLLVGFGSIGRRLAELLRPFDLEVLATRRHPRGDESCQVHPESDLPALLARADHVLDLLPATPNTHHYFGGARFAAMKRGAIFYNIGRGTTVEQEALRAALDRGHLGAAYLDVTDPEPLPPGHPLWETAGCVITPHTAGGHADEPLRLCEHFLENLARHDSGRPLIDRVI